jgi:hypothetical protein
MRICWSAREPFDATCIITLSDKKDEAWNGPSLENQPVAISLRVKEKEMFPLTPS